MGAAGLAGILAGIICAGAAIADTENVNGKAPDRLKAVSSDTGGSTRSDTFVNVPNAKLTIRARKGPIVITFSAECLASDDDANGSAEVFVRAAVDAVAVPPSSGAGVALCSTKDSVAETHSYTWVYKNPSAGKKTIRIRYRSAQSGDKSILDEYTLLVQFRKLKADLPL
jgi:hypothetical protein